MSDQEKSQVNLTAEQVEDLARSVLIKFMQLAPETQIKYDGIAQGLLLSQKMEKSA